MNQIIEISGSTGIGPYDVYLCDTTLNYCFLISGSTSIPPTIQFELPIMFQGSESVIVKLIDTTTSCEKFMIYNCGEAPIE